MYVAAHVAPAAMIIQFLIVSGVSSDQKNEGERGEPPKEDTELCTKDHCEILKPWEEKLVEEGNCFYLDAY